MKKHFLVWISVMLNLSVIAQSSRDSILAFAKIDSLENILYNSLSHDLTPINKISICHDLTELYEGISYKKQIEYAGRSLILAEELGETDLIIESISILAVAYYNLDNYEKSIEYNSRLFNLYNNKNDEIKVGEALYSIGNNYYSWSKYVKAKEYYERALNIFKKNQHFIGIAETLKGIATILSHWGEYDEALNFNQDALKFWEEIGDKEGIAIVYNNIGIIYQELGNLLSSSEYFHKSLEIFRELENTSSIVNVTLHIGDIYLQKELYDKALEYYFKADLIGKNINNKKLKSVALSNIGEAYNLKGDYLKALDYQQKALVLKKKIGDKRSLSITYTELGLIYFNVEDYNKALFYLRKGLKIAKEINFKYQLNKCYYNLSRIHESQGNNKKALEYFKLYIEGKEKINSEDSKQKIAELQAKYKVEKNIKENERLRHTEQLNRAQIRNMWLIFGFILFILLGSVVLSSVFHKRYQQNQKLNIQLSLKNKEIEEQQENVQNLNKELSEVNAAKDKFFSIVAHDLKNPFNSLIVLTSMLIEDYDTFSEEERMQFIKQIKSSSENTYSLLQNLLDWASSQTGKTLIVKRNIDLSKISKEAIALVIPTAKNKKITINTGIPQNTMAYADKNMISTVLLNLVSNAVKFTPQQGKVEVTASRKNKHIEVLVADTGVGIASANLNKLFRLDEKYHTDGTEKEKGTGLGLLLCKEFIEKNNGKIWVESIEGNGSRFYFSLPVS